MSIAIGILSLLSSEQRSIVIGDLLVHEEDDVVVVQVGVSLNVGEVEGEEVEEV